MTVSIITTCFNSALTIRHTLESVVAQDHPHIEHIVIDAGSTDGTIEIVSEFPHVSLLISERDRGIYHGMNKGLDVCTGDIICFLNSDDWYPQVDVISQVVNILNKNKVQVVYGDLQYVDRLNIEKIARTWRSGIFRRNSLYYGWMPPHPTFFVKKEVYELVGSFNTTLRNAADYELMLRVLLIHKFDASYLPQVLVKMRRGGFSNAKLVHRLRANREDHKAWQLIGLKPKFLTRYLKPLRKIPQFFLR
ncbi:MAG: glycosyltransferase family 2 protein [Bacteroidota bacterium]